jgi:hypothetical protein
MSGQSLIHFSAVVFTALALAPALAHAMELPNKIRLPRDSYLTVQRIYRGWQFAGVFVIGALIATFLLVWFAGSGAFASALIAFVCIIATQVVFWTLTFPVNRRTNNWTNVAGDWTRLRRRWEFSHALSAVLDLIAMVSVTLAVLADRAHG